MAANAVPDRVDPVSWKVSLALALAIAVTTGGLHVVFDDMSWWFLVVFVVIAVLGTSAATRLLTRRRYIPPLVAAAVLIGINTLLFAPDAALLWFIPTSETLGDYAALFDQGNLSIYRQSIPADADAAIVFVLCVGIGAIAVLSDLLAITLRLPALVGLPLFTILAIPAIVAREITDGAVFVLAAAAYLLVLVAGTTRRQPGLAIAIGAAAIAGALVLPAVLPAVDDSASDGTGQSSGVNPVLTLGENLRRASERRVLDYTTRSGDPHYLRLVSLENFTGTEWRPTAQEIDRDNTVDEFAPAPGLSDEVPTVRETTAVDVGNLTSEWLPVPYPPTSITGLASDWFWEPSGFAVSSPDDSARGLDYEVESLVLRPTPQQLLAAGTIVSPDLASYLSLPDDLPAVIAETASAVAGPARTNYERALALQEFFRSDNFTYSEDAPVDGDYDGTGMDIIATFLDVRSGYCVHFASSMAVMARSLDIPARVIVGFLPGSPRTTDEVQSFEVTTHDLHAWPELYFDGIGWVPFEPTPGRGELGAYADVSVAGVPAPTTPDAAAPGTPAVPTPSPSASLGPDRGADDGGTAGSAQQSDYLRWFGLIALGALLLSLLPVIVRAVQRRLLAARLKAGRASAIDAWTEVLKTAIDLRIPVVPTETPREAARTIDVGGGSLANLLEAVEQRGYAASTLIDSRTLGRDVDGVRLSLRRVTPWKVRILAFFYPASLWRRIAHPLAPDAWDER